MGLTPGDSNFFSAHDAVRPSAVVCGQLVPNRGHDGPRDRRVRVCPVLTHGTADEQFVFQEVQSLG